ncbi:uncharacterized protein V6R79_014068 [Siganus canaliculatus]
MAALDRRNPNLDEFVGLNWSCWVDRVNISPSDAESDPENSSKHGGIHTETMTLMKEDMHIYGHCPAHDEVYLVVCGHCGQVVKPQAFEKHCERRHGPLTKMCGQSSALASQQRPRPGHPLSSSSSSSSRERQKDGKCLEASATSTAALPVRQHRPAKAQKEAASLPTVEKFPLENPPLPQRSSVTPQPRVPPWNPGSLPRSQSSSATSRPVQKLTAGLSSDPQSALQGTRTYSRIYKNISKKECDLNKHCGVLGPERKKLCSQELKCNLQKVMQDTKTLDQRTTSAGRDLEQLLVKSKDKQELHLEASGEKATAQDSQYNLNTNSHMLRSRDPSKSFPVEEGDSTVEVEVEPPYPFNQSLLSSEESENDEIEEDADPPAAPWHPKPLALCTFGCRTLGCSIFTFDRRWQHLRFALSSMLEHHVSTHLWKKMPQVSSGLRSRHPTPLTSRSPARNESRLSKSTGSPSLDPTSLEHLETKSSPYSAQCAKAPSSATSGSLGLGLGQRHSSVGPSRARLRKPERDSVKVLHNNKDKSPKFIRDSPFCEKGQLHVPSSQAPVNGTFSHENKPCSALHRRGKRTGYQLKVEDFNHSAVAQKRKGSKDSPALSSSPSRASKCQRSSGSNPLICKGENIGGVVAWGLEKRSSS